MKPREKVVPKWYEKPYEWNQVSEKLEAVWAACPQDGRGEASVGLRERLRGARGETQGLRERLIRAQGGASRGAQGETQRSSGWRMRDSRERRTAERAAPAVGAAPAGSLPLLNSALLGPPVCLTLCNPMNYSPIQAPLSMEFSQQNTGVGCHFSSKGLPDPGIELESPALAGGFFTPEPPEALWMVYCM